MSDTEYREYLEALETIAKAIKWQYFLIFANAYNIMGIEPPLDYEKERRAIFEEKIDIGEIDHPWERDKELARQMGFIEESE